MEVSVGDELRIDLRIDDETGKILAFYAVNLPGENNEQYFWEVYPEDGYQLAEMTSNYLEVDSYDYNSDEELYYENEIYGTVNITKDGEMAASRIYISPYGVSWNI